MNFKQTTMAALGLRKIKPRGHFGNNIFEILEIFFFQLDILNFVKLITVFKQICCVRNP